MATLNFGPNTGPTYQVIRKSDDKVVFEGKLADINAWWYDKDDWWSCLIKTPAEHLKDSFGIEPHEIDAIDEELHLTVLGIREDVEELGISWDTKVWVYERTFYKLDDFDLEATLETELHGSGLKLQQID